MGDDPLKVSLSQKSRVGKGVKDSTKNHLKGTLNNNISNLGLYLIQHLSRRQKRRTLTPNLF